MLAEDERGAAALPLLLDAAGAGGGLAAPGAGSPDAAQAGAAGGNKSSGGGGSSSKGASSKTSRVRSSSGAEASSRRRERAGSSDRSKGLALGEARTLNEAVTAGKQLLKRGRRWVEQDPPRRGLGVAALVLALVWVAVWLLRARPGGEAASGGASSQAALRAGGAWSDEGGSGAEGGEGAAESAGGAAYGDEDGEDEQDKPKKRRKDKKEPEGGPSASELAADAAATTGLTHASDKAVQAKKFNAKLRGLVGGEGGALICPDKGGGNNNKACSKSYAEYLFKVPAPGSYYVYVETVAPNINDNSLWVGMPGLDRTAFATCPQGVKAGPLVPHKHVSAKKWLCCPKYLASNAKKNQGRFYCDCCTDSIGPSGTDLGCILDLEVSTSPQWNMLPRELKITSAKEPVAVRLYAREDGSAFTRVLLSGNPALAAKDII
jgi:hypothetical protein